MRLPLEWVQNTLAADDVTKWVRLPDCRKGMTIGIGWPTMGTPVGTLAVEVCNHGKAGIAGAVYPITISTNPAGPDATLLLDGIETAAKYLRMTYTRGSGGTDCVFTDESGQAGTTPSLEIRE